MPLLGDGGGHLLAPTIPPMLPRHSEQLYEYVNRYWWATVGEYPTPDECEAIVLTVAALLHLAQADQGKHDYLPLPQQDNRGKFSSLLG